MEEQKMISYVRGFFYAATIALGLILTWQQYDAGAFGSTRIFAIALSSVFGIELLSGWYIRFEAAKQVKLQLQRSLSARVQDVVNHLIVPINLYIWGLLFGFVNMQSSLRIAVLIIIFVLLGLLFTEIRMYYLNQNNLDNKLHYAFDVSKVLIIFLATNTLLNFSATGLIWVPAIVSLMSFGLVYLNIIKKNQIEVIGIYINLILSVCLALMLYVAVALGISNPIRLSMLSAVGYYFVSAILHHWQERDLTRAVIIEYIAFTVLVFLLTSTIG